LRSRASKSSPRSAVIATSRSAARLPSDCAPHSGCLEQNTPPC
jgi:hypothetical protein